MDEEIRKTSIQLLKKATSILKEMETHYYRLVELDKEFNEVLTPGALRDPLAGEKIPVPRVVRSPRLPNHISMLGFKNCLSLQTLWIRRIFKKYLKVEK